ncbi:MAG TPA: hypothetical protein VKD45_02515, partial [Hyphomicrobiaceae bacterium]|nr:hypothetical protein [Hyphomicrobiaceae bacterium]
SPTIYSPQFRTIFAQIITIAPIHVAARPITVELASFISILASPTGRAPGWGDPAEIPLDV